MFQNEEEASRHIAAVSCSAHGAMLGGVGLGFWLTGKLCRACYQCMGRCMGGAWVLVLAYTTWMQR